MSYDVILLIAGSGERCGLGYNKVLYKINGQPLFLYSLKKFLEFDECHKIILVLQEAEKDEIFQYIGKEYLEKVDFVYGGNIRQQSVLNGLEKVTEKYVLVHDGARPCITKEEIKKVVDSFEDEEGAIEAFTNDMMEDLEDSSYGLIGEFAAQLGDENIDYAIQHGATLDMDAVTNEVITIDGAGHILSGYDGKEP